VKNYILFDKLCEESYAAPFIQSAKELISKFDLPIKLENNFKKDLGIKTKSLNTTAFHLQNAYNLSIAAHDNLEILCVEDSSLVSLNLTKKALETDEKLKADIKNRLSIELNCEVKITHINELLLQEDIKSALKHPFSDFQAAIYKGVNALELERLTDTSATCKLLDLVGIKLVKTFTCKDNDGYELQDANRQIANRLAGTILLDAFDSAADFLVLNDVRTFSFFDSKQKEIAKEMGRDINLPLLTPLQVILLAMGIHEQQKLGLDTHKVKVTLI
jgi:succinate dehydrogenase / fumarate reductase cytochrome b subunit